MEGHSRQEERKEGGTPGEACCRTDHEPGMGQRGNPRSHQDFSASKAPMNSLRSWPMSFLSIAYFSIALR
jgi:hypothetical protein